MPLNWKFNTYTSRIILYIDWFLPTSVKLLTPISKCGLGIFPKWSRYVILFNVHKNLGGPYINSTVHFR